MTTPVIRCDCGHDSTPDGFASGYAVRDDGTTLCYQCAADEDLARLTQLQPGDDPVFAYIRGPLPEPHSRVAVEIVTWPGIVLGKGTVGRAGKYDTQMRVECTIGGRRFWGRTPTHNGNYTRLRPYADQKRAGR